MTWTDWKDVLVRSWKEASDDNVGLIAAGVAFYAFLAMVPLLGAIVLSYGLVAEPATVMRNVEQLTSVMPADAAKLVGEQLLNVVQTSGGKKGLGLLAALAVALFGARQGAGAIITALNIAYEEKEKRGFVMLNLLALAMTIAAVLVAIIATIAIAALGHFETAFPQLPGFVHTLGKVVSYAVLFAAAAAGAASLYRWGPSRDRAKWVWLTPGSVLTALLWLLLTVGFGIYVSKFGNYNATYGSLATVVVLLTWLYLSAYVLLFGAELNSELEHQTTADTTVGADKPMGERGAWSADHVASGEGAGTEEQGSKARKEAKPGMPSTTESGGSSRALLAGAGLFGLWLGRKLGVRKGKRIAAKKVAKAEQKGRRG
jgi:membrane protein